jgi:hypothetical protein
VDNPLVNSLSTSNMPYVHSLIMQVVIVFIEIFIGLSLMGAFSLHRRSFSLILLLCFQNDRPVSQNFWMDFAALPSCGVPGASTPRLLYDAAHQKYCAFGGKGGRTLS